MKRKNASLPPLRGFAELRADTLDKEARTVDVTFYSGAPVLRVPMFDDPFELEFEVSEKAVRLGRLKNGAPILDNHSRFEGVSGILGVVENARIEAGQARATARFSRREAVEPIWQDVVDGVVRNVSMGVQIHAMEEVTKKGAELKRFRATDWEPMEISFVGVGADPGAHTLSLGDAGSAPCRITYRAEAEADAPQGEEMKIKVRLLADVDDLGKTGEIVEILEADFDDKLHSKDLLDGDPPPKRTPSGVSAERLVDDAIENDRKHAAEIRKIAAHYGLDSVWAQRHINLATDLTQLVDLAKQERAKRAPKTSNDIGVGDDHESAAWRSEQMTEALVARAQRKEPKESARQYARWSMVECALECLGFIGKHRGLDARSDRDQIVQLALHTTDDFPLLLGNVLNKIMLAMYETAQPTYRQIASQRTFRDFRPHRFLRSGDFPVPQQVNEHGEYQYGTMGENEETVTMATFGRIIGFSRQAIINDDLGALDDLATKAAIRTVDFENSHFFTTVITTGAGLGPALSDGDTVYHANHANIAGAGALDVTRLGNARQLLMEQTSIDGIRLNILPTILLVSPASLTLAEQLTTTIRPDIVSSVNPFQGRLTPYGDANLTGTRFYVLADPARVPQYIYGGSGPRTNVREGFEIDGVEFKLSLDFAVGAIDFRGGVTGAGA